MPVKNVHIFRNTDRVKCDACGTIYKMEHSVRKYSGPRNPRDPHAGDVDILDACPSCGQIERYELHSIERVDMISYVLMDLMHDKYKFATTEEIEYMINSQCRENNVLKIKPVYGFPYEINDVDAVMSIAETFFEDWYKVGKKVITRKEIEDKIKRFYEEDEDRWDNVEYEWK